MKFIVSLGNGDDVAGYEICGGDIFEVTSGAAFYRHRVCALNCRPQLFLVLNKRNENIDIALYMEGHLGYLGVGHLALFYPNLCLYNKDDFGEISNPVLSVKVLQISSLLDLASRATID